MTDTGHAFGQTQCCVHAPIAEPEYFANPSSPMLTLHPNTRSLSNDCHVYKAIRRYEQ